MMNNASYLSFIIYRSSFIILLFLSFFMKNNIFVALFLAITFLLTACGKEKIVFEKEYPIPNSAWTYADTLDFAFDIVDTMALYDIVVHIKHRSDYGFQNLYTRISTKFPTGDRRSQTLNFDLADNTGIWMGKKSGDNRGFEVKIQENAFFNQTGQHVITLEQMMRVSSLSGIERMGLQVIDKGEKRKLGEENKGKKVKK
jgi:gliding motility-associated lipoprotein GldH